MRCVGTARGQDGPLELLVIARVVAGGSPERHQPVLVALAFATQFRQVVRHDGGILDEDRIRQVGGGGNVYHRPAFVTEQIAIGGVLRHCEGHIDRFAFEMS